MFNKKIGIILGIVVLAIFLLIIFFPKESFLREKFHNTFIKKSSAIKGTKNTPIFIMDNFLSDTECTELISSCKNDLIESPLTRFQENFRTSETCHFSDKDIQVHIENKITKLLNLDDQKTEKAQIQYYKIGKEFKPHYDYFDPEVDPDYLVNGQRSWTVMIYLNNVEEGGCTYFPELKEEIQPKKGRLVVWCNLDNKGKMDKNTLHQGLPVIKGEKWILTKWFLI